jgi:hypothetical protein
MLRHKVLNGKADRDCQSSARDIRAWGLEGGKGLASALRNVQAILESILRDAPAAGAKSA